MPGTHLEYMFLKDNAGNITLEDNGLVREYTVPYNCRDAVEKVSNIWEDPSGGLTDDVQGLGVEITITLDLGS